MMSAVHLVVFSAALLAMVGGLFGVCIARLVWADDLKHAERLAVNWNKSKEYMESTIDTQNQIIEIQKRRLGE